MLTVKIGNQDFVGRAAHALQLPLPDCGVRQDQTWRQEHFRQIP